MIYNSYVVDGLIVQVLGWDNGLDDFLLDLLAELLRGDSLSMLSADNNGVDSEWHNSTVIVLVLNGDLGLGIRSEPWQASVTSGGGHGSVQLVGQLESEGEEFWGLIGGIAKHDTLITSSQLLESSFVVKTLCDIWGLLLNGDKDIAGLVVETLCRIIISNVLNGSSDHLLVVKLGLGGNLSEDHYHTSLGGGLACNL